MFLSPLSMVSWGSIKVNVDKVSKSRGFTLLEVLVAMSIFAVIGLGANKMLRTMIDTHKITSSSNQSLTSMIRVFNLMERDFSQLVTRRVRDEYGDPLEPLMVGSGIYDVEFTRTGWNNPAQRSRSVLQRVAYVYDVEEKKLNRLFWLVLDRAQDSEPITQEILDEVENFSVNLLNEEGEGSDTWPDFDTDTALPLAVEIILETKKMGEIRRVFSLVSSAQAIARNQNRDANGDERGNESLNVSGRSAREPRRRR